VDARELVDQFKAFRNFEEYEDAELIRLKLRALYAAFSNRQIRRRRPMARAHAVITVSLTLRGEPTAVVAALANGLPLDALEGIRDGMQRELEERTRKPARGRRRVSIKVSNRKDSKR
jgi:cytochrome P450